MAVTAAATASVRKENVWCHVSCSCLVFMFMFMFVMFGLNVK